MILSPSVDVSTIQKAIDFYKTRYEEVHVIVCSSCKEELGIEVKGNVADLPINKLGFTVIQVNEKLISSRVRLDGVMGYQCLCGNDTRANIYEEQGSPTGAFLPHEVEAIKENMARKKFKPLVKQKGNKVEIESFSRVRVK